LFTSNNTDYLPLVYDTTPPVITITSPTNTSYNSGTITLNVTNDSVISTWWYSNYTGEVANETFTPNISIAGYPEGLNNITVFANDTSGNINQTTIFFTVDTTSPTVSLSCTPNPVTQGETLTCSCTASDATSGVNTTSYTTNPSTANTGTYTTSCTATDYAGNSASASTTYDVTGSSSTSFWRTTYRPSKEELQKGYNQLLRFRDRVKLKESQSGNYYIGIINVDKNSTEIEILSTSQRTILKVGDKKEFRLNKDDSSKVLIKLNKINEKGADITILYPYEKAGKTKEGGENLIKEKLKKIWKRKTNRNFWAVTIILLIPAILGLEILRRQKGKRRRKS